MKTLSKGLDEKKVREISIIKKEPDWMLKYRLDSYKKFNSIKMPKWGPKINLDFNNITYYKKVFDDVENNWDNVDKNVKKTFTDIGLRKAEEDYLSGMHVQYESESLYHNMLKELTDKKVIFLDTDTALKMYPDLFKKYFGKLVKNDDNKFAALNSSVWSGGTFIYVPPHTKLDRPLQSYFRIDSKDMGQFERTLIIVDHDSDLHYIEGCTAPSYSSDSLHAAVVEIYVGKNSKCRYTTIQNWAPNVYNLVTKRAMVEENGTMEWIDGNIGSKVTMKYPACILKGDYSKGVCTTIALADKDQIQDTGAKMIHIGKHTKSNILSKSIARNGGNASYRGLVKITKHAKNSSANVKCDTILLDEKSKSDTYPTNICENKTSTLEHEATVSKIDPNELFYLMTRGINEDKATELLIMGFIEAFKEELPLEYAVELNQLLKGEIIKECNR
ncbi:MAG: Fe-S cluster assembly protein SufB [Bacilli bacterium]|nr:Fe-S cluster assembly protein SufB [Bacilli bacterium]